MSISPTVAQCPSGPGRQRLVHTAVATVGALALLLSSPATAMAQAPAPKAGAWELYFSGGALVPTGVQRRALEDGHLSTAQVSYLVRSRVAITTMLGWTRSRDLVTAGDPRLSVYTYDLGVEARAPRWGNADGLSFMPFAGAGAGGRSHNHRDLDLKATHGVAGYASVGGEAARGRLRLRLEARDYVSGMAPLVGAGRREARNDVMLVAGLRIVKQRTPKR